MIHSDYLKVATTFYLHNNVLIISFFKYNNCLFIIKGDIVRNKFVGVLLLLGLLFIPTLNAKELPSIINKGFSEYKSNGAKAAIKAWSKGSALEGNREVLSYSNVLSQIEELYGSFQEHKLIKVAEIDTKSHIFYIIMNFEKGAVFSKFVAYKTDKKNSVINFFNFNTSVEAVWPSEVVFN